MQGSRKLNILYVAQGARGTTSHMRGEALARCGYAVDFADLGACLPRALWKLRLHWNTGFVFMDRVAARFLGGGIGSRRYDLIWVDNGSMVGPKAMQVLKAIAPRTINYNLDDPTGKRDGRRWVTFLRTVPYYDALVTVRRETEAELRAIGAQRVYRVFRSYDEVEHQPVALTALERERWTGEVLFAGTWMPERSKLARSLLELRVPLAIYGDRWQKAPEWGLIRNVWRGPAIYGRDYCAAIQASKICLGLVSKGNRDLHTQRSTEIPALGGLLCAERTTEHLELFEDGKEAVFWDDPTECAIRCKELLNEEERRASIAQAGQSKVKALRLGNEAVLGGIVEKVRASD